MGTVAGLEAIIADTFPSCIGGCNNALMNETKIRNAGPSNPIKDRLRTPKHLPGDFQMLTRPFRYQWVQLCGPVVRARVPSSTPEPYMHRPTADCAKRRMPRISCRKPAHGASAHAAHFAARAVNTPGAVSCSFCLPARRATRLEVPPWVRAEGASGVGRGAATGGGAGGRLTAGGGGRRRLRRALTCNRGGMQTTGLPAGETQAFRVRRRAHKNRSQMRGVWFVHRRHPSQWDRPPECCLWAGRQKMMGTRGEVGWGA